MSAPPGSEFGAAPATRSTDLGPSGPQVGASTSGTRAAGALGPAPTFVPAPPANPLQMFKPTGATLNSVKPVGRYALQFEFSDQHNTGIFTWQYLREICPCCAGK